MFSFHYLAVYNSDNSLLLFYEQVKYNPNNDNAYFYIELIDDIIQMSIYTAHNPTNEQFADIIIRLSDLENNPFHNTDCLTSNTTQTLCIKAYKQDCKSCMDGDDNVFMAIFDACLYDACAACNIDKMTKECMQPLTVYCEQKCKPPSHDKMYSGIDYIDIRVYESRAYRESFWYPIVMTALLALNEFGWINIEYVLYSILSVSWINNIILLIRVNTKCWVLPILFPFAAVLVLYGFKQWILLYFSLAISLISMYLRSQNKMLNDVILTNQILAQVAFVIWCWSFLDADNNFYPHFGQIYLFGLCYLL